MQTRDRLLMTAYLLTLVGFYSLMAWVGRWCFGVTALVWISAFHLGTQFGLIMGIAPWRPAALISTRRRLLAAVAAGLVIAVPTGVPAGYVAQLVYERITASVGQLFAFLTIILLAWGAWTAILFRNWADRDRLAAVRQLLTWIAGGGVALSLFSGVIYLEFSSHELAKIPLVVSLYLLVWPLGPALLCWIYRHRLQVRGRCPACGYDLHGLSQMRCPECGRAFTFEEVNATAEELQTMGDSARQ
jgi:hypothetical protein